MSDGRHLNFYFKGACTQKVKCIKMVRAITGMGLKESKLLVERAEREIVHVEFQNNDYHTLEQCKHIIEESEGWADFGHFEKYIESMREVATAATLAGDYYVAKRIISFLEDNF